MTFKEYVFAEYITQTLGTETSNRQYLEWKETLYIDEWLDLGQRYGDYIKKLMKEEPTEEIWTLKTLE